MMTRSRMVASAKKLMAHKLSPDEASSFLIKADALPLMRLLPAHQHWQAAAAGDAKDINHPKTWWGIKQAITAEWKSLGRFGMMDRSAALKASVIAEACAAATGPNP